MITPDMTSDEMWIEWMCLTVDLLNAGGDIDEMCNQILEEKGDSQRMREIIDFTKLVALYWKAGTLPSRDVIHRKLQETN